jgi:citrate synthase
VTSDAARLSLGDRRVDLPIVPSVEGGNGLDISKLRDQTGNVTLDNGFANTASCKSAITYIDGEAGILRYRGYPIEQLAEHSNFLETAYLVIYGELPTAEELDRFTNDICRSTMLDERMRDFFRTLPRRSHPMPVLSAGIIALSLFAQDAVGFEPNRIERATHQLIAKVPTLAAYGYKNSRGEPTLYPDNSLSYVENFLRMSFGYPTEPYEFTDDITRALDVLLILHADHEQNCSTSTVRVVGSSQANLFVSVAAGVSALSGPLHGGANQAVLEMLRQIQADGTPAQTYINRVKDSKDHTRLMGFGHRIYRNYDPRAAIVKRHADAIVRQHTGHDALLDLAVELEQAALADPYFQERKLYPNVDFYTGLIYQAMGFPVEMFTVLFAIGRLPGWIAHWREMVADSTNKIARPRQIYTGRTERAYQPLEARS